jgi:hypothetical protein
MGLNLALAAAALAVVAHTPPAGDTLPAAWHGDSFIHLADTLDVATVALPPPADNRPRAGHPGAPPLVAAGHGRRRGGAVRHPQPPLKRALRGRPG